MGNFLTRNQEVGTRGASPACKFSWKLFTAIFFKRAQRYVPCGRSDIRREEMFFYSEIWWLERTLELQNDSELRPLMFPYYSLLTIRHTMYVIWLFLELAIILGGIKLIGFLNTIDLLRFQIYNVILYHASGREFKFALTRISVQLCYLIKRQHRLYPFLQNSFLPFVSC